MVVVALGWAAEQEVKEVARKGEGRGRSGAGGGDGGRGGGGERGAVITRRSRVIPRCAAASPPLRSFLFVLPPPSPRAFEHPPFPPAKMLTRGTRRFFPCRSFAAEQCTPRPCCFRSVTLSDLS